MKLYYGHRDPDLDDIQGQLGEMIALGVVPAGCKLGGQMVYKEYAAGRDPCAFICPHEERDGPNGCGGRPQDPVAIYEKVGLVRQASNRQQEAREALVANQVQHLRRMEKETRAHGARWKRTLD